MRDLFGGLVCLVVRLVGFFGTAGNQISHNFVLPQSYFVLLFLAKPITVSISAYIGKILLSFVHVICNLCSFRFYYTRILQETGSVKHRTEEFATRIGC